MISEAYREEAVFVRRALHQIPETGFEEHKTQAFLRDYLEKLGYETKTTAKTGLLTYLDMGREETIALRADMDALPIEEETGASYRSLHRGRMHACGHDGHMSMLLLLAKYLKESGRRAKYNLLFLFQPAEEGPGGAKEILEEGVLKEYGVSRVYGFHLSPEYPAGIAASRPGEFFASGVELYIDVTGVSTHGAQPHMGKDAVLIASQLVVNLHTVVCRDLSPLSDGVLSIGTFHAGDQMNVIAGSARLTGIVRAFNEPARDKLVSRVSEICAGMSQTYGVPISFRPVVCYPPLINNAALYEDARRLLGEGFMTAEKVMLSEDFAYYTKQVPSLFLFLGTNDNTKAHSHPLHSSRFDFDEGVLLRGVEAYLKLIGIDAPEK